MKVIPTIAASITFMITSSVVPAQESQTGIVKQIDRLNGTIAIEQSQSGTTGGSAGLVKQYKVQGSSLEELHAGDQVNFSAAQVGGGDTITRIEKKK